MRSSRLLRALLLLQRRGRLTAAELAAELEVSVPTARRDLEALAAAGVPVYARPGRGGGWQLVGGARTDLTGLTGPEVEALFGLLSAGGSGVAASSTAVDKLVMAVPERFRAAAEAAASAVHHDPARWGEEPAAAPAAVEALRRAIVDRRVVELAYRGRRTGPGPAGRRRVEPLGLIDKDGTWYLLAGTDAGRRTFRVDRIVELTVGEASFERPAELDLAREWEATAAEVEQLRSGVAATVLAPARLLPALRQRFGRHIEVVAGAGAGTPDGRGDALVEVVVRAHRADGLAEQLAGWASHVEVTGSPEIRHELARIGAVLVDRYGRAPAGPATEET